MTTTNEPRILTLSLTATLGELLTAVRAGNKCRWLAPNGDIATGVLRSIGDERGNFAGPDDDIRDCFVRVSSMLELFFPVMDVIALIHKGEFSLNG